VCAALWLRWLGDEGSGPRGEGAFMRVRSPGAAAPSAPGVFAQSSGANAQASAGTRRARGSPHCPGAEEGQGKPVSPGAEEGQGKPSQPRGRGGPGEAKGPAPWPPRLSPGARESQGLCAPAWRTGRQSSTRTSWGRCATGPASPSRALPTGHSPPAGLLCPLSSATLCLCLPSAKLGLRFCSALHTPLLAPVYSGSRLCRRYLLLAQMLVWTCGLPLLWGLQVWSQACRPEDACASDAGSERGAAARSSRGG